MLSITGLTKLFGSLAAVNDVSFEMKERQIVSLIGPNGAGKTTVFHLVTGFLRPNSGRITFLGQDLTRLKPFQIAERGISRTFQERAVFPNLSVMENLLIGVDCRGHTGVFGAILNTPSTRREENETKEKAARILDLLELGPWQNTLAKDLTYEHVSRLEIAVALGTEPKLLLLDEPMMGMNPTETKEMMSLLTRVRESGITILLIEHDMRAVMGMSDWVVVLDYGEKIAEGTAEEIRSNQAVINAYLGV